MPRFLSPSPISPAFPRRSARDMRSLALPVPRRSMSPQARSLPRRKFRWFFPDWVKGWAAFWGKHGSFRPHGPWLRGRFLSFNQAPVTVNRQRGAAPVLLLAGGPDYREPVDALRLAKAKEVPAVTGG